MLEEVRIINSSFFSVDDQKFRGKPLTSLREFQIGLSNEGGKLPTLNLEGGVVSKQKS